MKFNHASVFDLLNPNANLNVSDRLFHTFLNEPYQTPLRYEDQNISEILETFPEIT